METAYITKSSYKRLGKALVVDDNVSIDEIFAALYGESLRQIINSKEAKDLHIRKLMIEEGFANLKMAPRRFSPAYVLSVGNPKFHLIKDCSYLQSDFLNFLVPPEIEAQGHDKVREFQEYCEENRKELYKEPNDAFWAIVRIKFKIKNTPKQISILNSGVHDLGDISVEDLQAAIDKSIKEANRMLHDPHAGASIRAVRYARHINVALSSLTERSLTDESIEKTVRAFFDTKWKIINSLFDLYVKQSGLRSFVVPLTILKSASFEPCRGCCFSSKS
ncbi:hypothetical protein NOV72_01562 [Caballeronia novacaledonica]|uniref:Uncharacterized protein n=1 Tax=Caballeronia novacaledonica TaxID=1544861 RepID=A0A2U3I2G2_9BURK|nr:hypothetical protein [Caballeronia novacaledonica]SPB14312.1 hypothetical protein NOV72_01562 [Caballeronia novacaledonica]